MKRKHVAKLSSPTQPAVERQRLTPRYTPTEADNRLLRRVHRIADAHGAVLLASYKRLVSDLRETADLRRRVDDAVRKGQSIPERPPRLLQCVLDLIPTVVLEQLPQVKLDREPDVATIARLQICELRAAVYAFLPPPSSLMKPPVPDVTWPEAERHEQTRRALAVADLLSNPNREMDGVGAWDARTALPRGIVWEALLCNAAQANGFLRCVEASLLVAELDGPTRGEAEPTSSGQAPANSGNAGEIRHAPDFSWIVAADGKRYDFETPRTREVIGALVRCWKEAGDGAGLTEQALPVEIERPAMKSRPDKLFAGHPALGTILRRTAPATWALFLRSPDPGPQKDL